jgi:hypothetical protein
VLGQTVNDQNGDEQVRNLILIKIDDNGVIKLKKLIDNKGRKMGFSILEISDNSLFILGTTDYLTYGGTDIYLINCDSSGFFRTALQSYDFRKNLSVYPNPTTGSFRIKSNNNNSIKSIKLFSLNGVELVDYSSKKDNEFFLSVDKGVYLIEIIDNNNKRQICRLIKK